MRRADRLFQIVQHLRGGRLVTAQGLAERLEVSPRTIYRDIADLQGSGVPIEGEAGVGYIMAAGFDLPPLMFTRDEVTALVAGARLLQAFGGAEMGRAAEEALVKIRAVLPEAEQGPAREVALAAIGVGFDAPLRARLDSRCQSSIDGRLPPAFWYYRDEAGQPPLRVGPPLGAALLGQGLDADSRCASCREGFPHVPRRTASMAMTAATLPPPNAAGALSTSTPASRPRPRE